MKTWEKIIVIGFVILNSISGLQISGISVNAVFVGLFTVFAGVEFLKHKNKGGMKIPRASGFLLFILCSMVSCLFSMAYDFRVEHYNSKYVKPENFFVIVYLMYYMIFLVRSESIELGRSFVYYAVIPILISKLLKTKTVRGGGKTS